MTTRIVMLKYADPTALGDVGTPNGYIECRPTRRRDVGDTVVLPSRFSVKYGAALMDGDTEVRPATPGVAWAKFECTDVPATWGWTLVERTDRGARGTYLIPSTVSDDVPLTELEQVDPDSFDPVAPPDPAWLPAIADLQAQIDAVEASDVDSVAGLTGTVTAAALKTAISLPSDTVASIAALQAELDQEETDRAAGDSALSTALGLETTARQLADTALDGRVTTAEGTLASLPATYASFVNLAKNPDAIITGAITRNFNGVVTSAAVVWPNGQPGTYTTDAIGSLNTIDGYHITYGSPVARTYTQPTVTRDGNGAATNVPAITVA